MKSLLRKSLNFILSVTLICSFSFTIFATETTTIPVKPNDYFVCDMANVIGDTSTQDIALINQQDIADYGEIVVVTVENVQGITLADYTKQLFEEWQIGGVGVNGALLVMDTDGDYYRCIIGSGLSSYINESQLKEILEGQVEYYFKNKDYDSAAYMFANTVSAKITAKNEDSTDSNLTTDDTTSNENLDEDATTPNTDDKAEIDTKDETKGNAFVSVLFTIFKVILIIILILLILIVVFLVLVNIRSKKRKKHRRNRQRNNQGK